MAQTEAYQEKAEAQLAELQARIDLLEAKAKQAKAETKLEYEKTMENLRAQQDQITGQLAKVRSASEGAWEELRAGIDSALTDLQTSLDKAAAKFE